MYQIGVQEGINMELNVNKISIKKLDAYKESTFSIEKDNEIQLTVSINISLFELKKVNDKDVIFKSGFSLNLSNMENSSDIGRIDSQLDLFVTTDDQASLVSEWESTDKILSPVHRKKIDNAIFYYIMPLVINITDKMQMPIPIPSLNLKT